MDGKLTSAELVGDLMRAAIEVAFAAHQPAVPVPKELEQDLSSARAALIERLNQRDTLLAVLKQVMAALRKEAPGTPLNNRRFDELGVRANNIIDRAESTP